MYRVLEQGYEFFKEFNFVSSSFVFFFVLFAFVLLFVLCVCVFKPNPRKFSVFVCS